MVQNYIGEAVWYGKEAHRTEGRSPYAICVAAPSTHSQTFRQQIEEEVKECGLVQWVLNVLHAEKRKPLVAASIAVCSSSKKEIEVKALWKQTTLRIPVYQPKCYKMIKDSETCKGAWFRPVITEPVQCAKVRVYEGDCLFLWKELLKNGEEVDVRFMPCDPPRHVNVEGSEVRREESKLLPPSKVCFFI